MVLLKLQGIKRYVKLKYYHSSNTTMLQHHNKRFEQKYKSDCNVYVSCNINNPIPVIPVQGGTTQQYDFSNIIAKYEVQKTIPILSKASDYFCTVTKFSIPTNSIPITIIPALAGQSIAPLANAPNVTTLVIGIDDGTHVSSQNLIWVPDPNQTPPTQNDPNNQVLGGEYYYMYSYFELINMINTALKVAWVDIGLATIYPTLIPPFMGLNSATGIITLYAPEVIDTTNIKIFCNAPLANFLDGFAFTTLPGIPNTPAPFGEDYIFITTPASRIPEQAYTPPYIAMPNPPIYYKYDQDHSTLPLWSSMRRLVLVSNTIPISPEYLPASSGSQANTAGNNVAIPVLSEFSVATESVADVRSIAYYTPSAQYRLVDLMSDAPLSKIDVQVFWQDSQGRLFPLVLSPGQQVDITIGFFRKELYTKEEYYTK